MAADEREDRDLNRDPITEEPGAHPVGTGVGATGGAIAGGAAGAVAGPVGMAIGGIVGAVVGGLAGKAAGEALNPTAEEEHWRENYSKEPYYQSGRSFDDYGPAYRLGYESRTRLDDPWTSVEPRLASEWESTRGNSTLNWNDASPAARAAWERVDTNYVGRSGGGSTGMGSTGGMGTTAGLGGTAAGMGTAGSDMRQDIGAGTGMRQSMGTGSQTLGASDPGMQRAGMDTGRQEGAAGMVGAMQSSGDSSGDRDDVIDVLKDLVECSKDGEYGFRECAEQATRADLKQIFLERADGCRQGAQELNQLIRQCGGTPEEGGSAMGAMHRGWVAIKSKLTTYDDKAVLEECERGEDNAKARYRKALEKNLPEHVRQVVERQMQQVQRNHDQVKALRDQARAGA